MKERHFEALLLGAYALGLIIGVAPTLLELTKALEEIKELCQPNPLNPRPGPAPVAENSLNKNTSRPVFVADRKRKKKPKTTEDSGKT